MEAGDAMIALALVTILGACLTRIISLRSGDKKMASASANLSILTFVIITFVLILLAYFFLASDMSYNYVWSHSSTDLDTAYKLSAVWAGAEGSFLFWVWLMTTVLAVEVMLEPKRAYLGRRFHGIFQILLTGILSVFILMLLSTNLFARTNPALLNPIAGIPNGWGLTLSLQTPEMIVHPPVVFAGYAFCVAAVCAAVAFFYTGEGAWHKIALPWTRLGWIFLTLGIGIGGLWAYYVLGWGGYWAWDPVETSSLVPWFLATALLHSLLRHSRKSEYQVMAPVLGILTFVGVLFAAFATRAGSIWTSSVHAFTSGSGETAASRLMSMLAEDGTVLGLFSIMFGFLALAVFLGYRRHLELGTKEEEPAPEKLSGYISDRNNMLMTVSLLTLTTAVMMVILLKNVDTSQSANYVEFNQKMSIFFVLIMVTMSLCLVWRMLGKDRALVFSVVLLAISVVSALVASLMDSSIDWLVAFSLPSYVVAVAASIVRMARSFVRGSARKSLFRIAPQMVHMGVALVLVSYVVSSNMETYSDESQQLMGGIGAIIGVNEQIDVGDYALVLKSLDITPVSYDIGSLTVNYSQDATFDILKSGKVIATDIVLSNLYGSDFWRQPSVLKVEVYVHKAILEDLYINFQWVDDQNAFVQSKVIPMMNFLWAGFVLLVVGLVVRLGADPRSGIEAVEPVKARSRAAPEEKKAASQETGKDYEAIVEEELRRFKEKRAGK